MSTVRSSRESSDQCHRSAHHTVHHCTNRTESAEASYVNRGAFTPHPIGHPQPLAQCTNHQWNDCLMSLSTIWHPHSHSILNQSAQWLTTTSVQCSNVGDPLTTTLNCCPLDQAMLHGGRHCQLCRLCSVWSIVNWQNSAASMPAWPSQH